MKLPQRVLAFRRQLLFKKTLLTIPRHPASDKTRLALITGELEVGGVSRVLLNIIGSLPLNRFEIYIFTTDPRVNNWSLEFSKHVNLIVDIPPTIGRSLSQKYVRKYLETYISKNKMDVLFITNSTTGYESLPHIKANGSSKTAKVYDLLHTHGRPEDNDAFLKISMPFDGYIDKRIVISDYLKSYFCAHYPVAAEKVIVIYNGVGETVLSQKADAAHGRALLGLAKDERAITFLGRLQGDKSPDRLIELASILKPELDEHHVFIAIVGEGSLEESLRKRAQELGVMDKQVRFYLFTDTPLDICRASLYTIITSDLEGIPMSALESMLMHTPVIAPAVGGLPEIVDDKRDGFLASFADKTESEKLGALAAVIREALQQNSHYKTAMNERAYQKVCDKFSTMGQYYLKLFEKS